MYSFAFRLLKPKLIPKLTWNREKFGHAMTLPRYNHCGVCWKVSYRNQSRMDGNSGVSSWLHCSRLDLTAYTYWSQVVFTVKSKRLTLRKYTSGHISHREEGCRLQIIQQQFSGWRQLKRAFSDRRYSTTHSPQFALSLQPSLVAL